jgi:hypothetical protein
MPSQHLTDNAQVYVRVMSSFDTDASMILHFHFARETPPLGLNHGYVQPGPDWNNTLVIPQ